MNVVFWLDLLFLLVKILLIFAVVLTSVPFLVVYERKLLGWIQQRPGPNRVGPWGLFQLFADAAKLFLKEDFKPDAANRVLYAIAPMFTVAPSLIMLSIVPFGPALNFTLPFKALDGHIFSQTLCMAPLQIGILFYLAMTGIAVYGLVLAGWASNNKYSLLGGIRASAQMISYELAMGLSIVGVLLIGGTVDLYTIINQQSGWFWNWYIFKQPVGFVLFLVAGFAESNRLPFDLPECESELGCGYNTEYSSMKYAMFMMGEYVSMVVFAGILSTLFLGGFNAPFPSPYQDGSFMNLVWGVIWIALKIFLILSFMMLCRGTLPRFRYDQLMDLGWKLMLPMALFSLIITTFVMVFHEPISNDSSSLGLTWTLVLFIVGAAQLYACDLFLVARRKRMLKHVS